jgi:hypothetical protein
MGRDRGNPDGLDDGSQARRRPKIIPIRAKPLTVTHCRFGPSESSDVVRVTTLTMDGAGTSADTYAPDGIEGDIPTVLRPVHNGLLRYR